MARVGGDVAWGSSRAARGSKSRQKDRKNNNKIKKLTCEEALSPPPSRRARLHRATRISRLERGLRRPATPPPTANCAGSGAAGRSGTAASPLLLQADARGARLAAPMRDANPLRAAHRPASAARADAGQATAGGGPPRNTGASIEEQVGARPQ